MFALAADISLRIVAAAAAVGLVLVVLRVRSGAARHAAWSAVLLAMLTMPVLMAIVPLVDVPVPSTLALDFGAIAGEASPHEPWETPVSPDITEPQPSVAVTSPALEGKERPSRLAFDWRIAAIALYAAGALFFFVRIAVGWILARRLVARGIRVAYDNRALVFESPAIATPMTTGIVSPCVLLPVTWREWPEDKLQAVMAHENAHIARRDSLVALLAHANRDLLVPSARLVAAAHAGGDRGAGLRRNGRAPAGPAAALRRSAARHGGSRSAPRASRVVADDRRGRLRPARHAHRSPPEG